jgi:hypothetical protein
MPILDQRHGYMPTSQISGREHVIPFVTQCLSNIFLPTLLKAESDVILSPVSLSLVIAFEPISRFL